MRITYKTETDYEEFIRNKKNDPFKKARDAAKAVNFGSIYQQTKYGLAMKLIITEDEAEAIINAKAAAFPGVEQWKKDRREFHIREKYAITMLGARKHLILDGTWKDDSVLRSAGNFEVQSPAAEQAKIVMSKLWDRQFFERYPAEFKFPVHDEINFTCRRDSVVEALKEAHEIMVEQYADMTVPIASSIEIGPNFGQLHNIGEVFDESKILEVLEGI